MTSRLPLVNVNGDIKELPSTDNIDGSRIGLSPSSNNNVLYNNDGVISNMQNLGVHNNDPVLIVDSSYEVPTVPNVDTVKLYATRFGTNGGRVMPAVFEPSGMNYVLQPSIWRQKISRWNAPGGGTTVPGVDGMLALSTGGTATSRSVATTNALTRAKRIGYVSSTRAGNYGGVYQSVAQFTLGNGTIGGFFMSFRGGVSDATMQKAARTFIGMSSATAAPTNVDPATLTNSFGFGHTASDKNWFFYYGGSTAQTRVSLGTNFPINNKDFYDFTLWSPPNENMVVYYYVERVTTTAQYFTYGFVNSNGSSVYLPSNTTLLAFRAWRNNNTAAASVGLDISSIYLETDW